jgi:hypothetical protein
MVAAKVGIHWLLWSLLLEAVVVLELREGDPATPPRMGDVLVPVEEEERDKEIGGVVLVDVVAVVAVAAALGLGAVLLLGGAVPVKADMKEENMFPEVVVVAAIVVDTASAAFGGDSWAVGLVGVVDVVDGGGSASSSSSRNNSTAIGRMLGAYLSSQIAQAPPASTAPKTVPLESNLTSIMGGGRDGGLVPVKPATIPILTASRTLSRGCCDGCCGDCCDCGNSGCVDADDGDDDVAGNGCSGCKTVIPVWTLTIETSPVSNPMAKT